MTASIDVSITFRRALLAELQSRERRKEGRASTVCKCMFTVCVKNGIAEKAPNFTHISVDNVFLALLFKMIF